jgi:hypothetical protein
MKCIIVNDELGGMWKWWWPNFKGIFQHLPGRTEEKQVNPYSNSKQRVKAYHSTVMFPLKKYKYVVLCHDLFIHHHTKYKL